jgi:hypothetical protein
MNVRHFMRPVHDGALDRQVLRRGFWADVVNGPYHSFGTWVPPTDASRLLRTRNKEFIFTAAEVAKHNVMVRTYRNCMHKEPVERMPSTFAGAAA